MAQQRQTRRDFLRSAALGASAVAAAQLVTPGRARVAGSNERLSIGVIGCGDRGRDALMKQCLRFSDEENVEITAVCDPWKEMREKAVAMAKEKHGRDPRQFAHYQDLLALEDIDAVMIACPDHQHATVLAAAARAGKDAYCEKPWAMNLEELIEAVDAVKQANRIVQAGTQLRSYPSFTGCRKLVQSGALGKVFKVEQVRNNKIPYWHQYARPIKESDTDWKAFLMHKRYRPWDPDQYSAWYGYRDFSSGPIGGYMSHYIDLVHYITGQTLPWRAVSLGGKYVFDDPRTCPDVIHSLLEYPKDMLVSYATSCGNSNGSYTHFIGTRGMIDCTDWENPVVSGEGAVDDERIKEEGPVEPVEMLPHMQDWLRCLRSRKQPNANVDAGYSHAVACILSDRAYAEGCRMVYDAEKRRMYAG